MDYFHFMTVVADIYSESKTQEELENKKQMMIKAIEEQYKMSKLYLERGIL